VLVSGQTTDGFAGVGTILVTVWAVVNIHFARQRRS
jgi:hypothetical protein